MRKIWQKRVIMGLVWLAGSGWVVWLLYNISLHEAFLAIIALTTAQIFALIGMNGLVLLTFSGRWWLILRALGYPLPYLTLAGYRLAAFGVSYFTPGPQFGGEPVQIYLVQHRHRVPAATALTAVALDKLLELLVNFIFLVGGITLMLQQQLLPATISRWALLGSSGLLALPALTITGLMSGSRPLSGLLDGIGRIVEQFQGQRVAASSSFWRVAALLSASEAQADDFFRQRPAVLGGVMLISGLSWAAIIAEYWLMLRFLGVELTISQTLMALTMARVAILLPLPGGLGALEASQVLALSLWGYSPALGLSLGLLIRARDVLLGGLGLAGIPGFVGRQQKKG